VRVHVYSKVTGENTERPPRGTDRSGVSGGRDSVLLPARRLLAPDPIVLIPFPNPVVLNGFFRLQRPVRSGLSPLSVSCRILISRCI